MAIHYIFGLSTNAVLAAQVFTKTDDVCVRRATCQPRPGARLHRDPLWRPNPGRIPAVSRGAEVEATRKGLDVRYVITNITHGYRRVALRQSSTAHVDRRRT